MRQLQYLDRTGFFSSTQTIILFSSASGPIPGLIHQELVSCAGEVLNVSARFAVDAIPSGFAHSQEVWTQAADGVLGYVCQRLARGGPENIAPHGFVDARHIFGSQ